MKKILGSIILIVFAGLFCYGLYHYIYNLIHEDEEITIINDGKNNNNKDEYIYKEDLLTLGYTISDIENIKKKISDNDVKKYLLEKKYDNLLKFISSPYFKIENISRYENYYKKNNSYSIDDVVIYVEIGLDIEFYTNIQEVTDYKKIDTLINKYYKLPDDYSLDDLISIDSKYKKSSTDFKLRKEALEHLYEMIDAASEDNISLWVVSAYRTLSTQKSLFNNSVKNDGMDHALIYSAKPGHSEHNLGLAVDLNLASSKGNFDKTKEYEWLKQNSYKYGFIERYPKGKEFITGYGFEPWHYRYLGIDLATNVYLEGVTYEEYLVKHAK